MVFFFSVKHLIYTMLFGDPSKHYEADNTHQDEPKPAMTDIDLSTTDKSPSKGQQMLTMYRARRARRINADPFEFIAFGATWRWLDDLSWVFMKVGISEPDHYARMWLVRQVVAESTLIQMAGWTSSQQENFDEFEKEAFRQSINYEHIEVVKRKKKAQELAQEEREAAMARKQEEEEAAAEANDGGDSAMLAEAQADEAYNRDYDDDDEEEYPQDDDDESRPITIQVTESNSKPQYHSPDERLRESCREMCCEGTDCRPPVCDKWREHIDECIEARLFGQSQRYTLDEFLFEARINGLSMVPASSDTPNPPVTAAEELIDDETPRLKATPMFPFDDAFQLEPATGGWPRAPWKAPRASQEDQEAFERALQVELSQAPNCRLALDHDSSDAQKVEMSSPPALSDVIASEEDDLDIQLENEVLLEDEACFGDDLESVRSVSPIPAPHFSTRPLCAPRPQLHHSLSGLQRLYDAMATAHPHQGMEIHPSLQDSTAPLRRNSSTSSLATPGSTEASSPPELVRTDSDLEEVIITPPNGKVAGPLEGLEQDAMPPVCWRSSEQKLSKHYTALKACLYKELQRSEEERLVSQPGLLEDSLTGTVAQGGRTRDPEAENEVPGDQTGSPLSIRRIPRSEDLRQLYLAYQASAPPKMSSTVPSLESIAEETDTLPHGTNDGLTFMSKAMPQTGTKGWLAYTPTLNESAEPVQERPEQTKSLPSSSEVTPTGNVHSYKHNLRGHLDAAEEKPFSCFTRPMQVLAAGWNVLVQAVKGDQEPVAPPTVVLGRRL